MHQPLQGLQTIEHTEILKDYAGLRAIVYRISMRSLLCCLSIAVFGAPDAAELSVFFEHCGASLHTSSQDPTQKNIGISIMVQG